MAKVNKAVEELLQKITAQNKELTKLKKQAWNEKLPFGWITTALQINNMLIANLRFSASETVEPEKLSYILKLLTLNQATITSHTAPDDDEELG